MKINIDSLVSITEANQNFSKIARLVDQNGSAIILKNNKPRYVILEYSQFEQENWASEVDIREVGESLIKKHLEAFKELAK